MPVREQLLSIAKRVKAARLIDLAIRYHPWHRTRTLHAIAAFSAANATERERLAEEYRSRALDVAARTAYGRRYGHAFESWPILGKTTVRDHTGDFFTHTFPHVPASTGGTTGTPIRLERSWRCIAAEQAFIDHLLQGDGVTFRSARIVVLRADEVKPLDELGPPYGVWSADRNRLVLSNAHLSEATVSWFVGAIRDLAPQVLWVYPSMLANLIVLMQKAQLSFEVPLVLASSERVDAPMFDAVKRVLGARLIDYYGQGERVCFAAGSRPEAYRFEPAYGYVELLPVDDEPVADGTRSMRIVATGYWNEAMPLVRYDTGDHAIVPADATPQALREIALGVRPFLGIAGRSNEFVLARGGRQIGGLNHLPREVDHVLRLQVIQESLDQIRIDVLPAPGFNAEDMRRIEANARGLIPAEVALEIRAVDRLEAAPNGKTPFVIRRC